MTYYPFFYQFGSTTSVGNPILDLLNWVQLRYTEQYPLQKLQVLLGASLEYKTEMFQKAQEYSNKSCYLKIEYSLQFFNILVFVRVSGEVYPLKQK